MGTTSYRSMENLPRAIKLADDVTLYDNSGHDRQEVAYYEKGALINEYSSPPAWYKKVKAALPILISPDNMAEVCDKMTSVFRQADHSRRQFFEIGEYENTLVSVEKPKDSDNNFNVKTSSINNPKKSKISKFEHDGKKISLNDFMKTVDTAVNSLKAKQSAGHEPPPSGDKTKKTISPKFKP